MVGRGIDQCLRTPSDPILFESFVKDARVYVDLAREKNGSIPEKFDPGYLWGDALKEVKRLSPDLFLINLETAITTQSEPFKSKAVHYRMHPGNVSILNELGATCCSVANNHSLDWGRAGFEETLDVLKKVKLQIVGGGRNLEEATKPAEFQVGNKKLLVFSVGGVDSGIPSEWAATKERSGLWVIEDFNAVEAGRICEQVRAVKTKEDFVILSIHWGVNWGYPVPESHQKFAHFLIDEGCVDLIHGHSSHHVKRWEVYRGKLILYGCGDFMTDYEGISGHEAFHPQTSLLYFAKFDMQSHLLIEMETIPFTLKRFQLKRLGRI